MRGRPPHPALSTAEWLSRSEARPRATLYAVSKPLNSLDGEELVQASISQITVKVQYFLSAQPVPPLCVGRGRACPAPHAPGLSPSKSGGGPPPPRQPPGSSPTNSGGASPSPTPPPKKCTMFRACIIRYSFIIIHYFALARVSPMTFSAPAMRRQAAHSAIVAPLVTTSSTRTTCFPVRSIPSRAV